MAGTVDLTIIDPLLKDEYGPAIREELPKLTPMVDLFEKAEDVQFEGRNLIEVVEVAGNHNVVWLPEGGPIPTAGRPKFENMKITPKYCYGSMSLTNQAIVMARS